MSEDKKSAKPQPEKEKDTDTPGESADTQAEKSEQKTPEKPTAAKPAEKEAKPSAKKGSGDADGGSPAENVDSTVPPRRGSGLLIALLILLLIGVLGGAGYGGWWGWQQWLVLEEDRAAAQADWESERAALSQRLDGLESELASRDGAIDSLADDLDSTRDDLIMLAEQVSRESGLQAHDVQRLEVEYLLRTARHLSYLTGDLRQAENLLQQADRMVRDFEDLAYLPVREAIAADIQALRAVPSPDVDGLYFELAALASQAARWEWWPDNQFAADSDREPLADDALWYERLTRELRDLVNIRYREDIDARRLSASEFAQARTQFRLLMQQAQAALLQGRQSLYEASLEQAIEWVQEGGNQIPQATRLIEQLETLREIEVQVQVPDIDRGLIRLQALLEAREQDEDEEDDE
ncbi:MAG: uroporphyrinogen-III C-methyltransferase [Natronospirillum sp.]|uniref:uroporphyrinogen-III C-methyltransferase n=1 Tax=Natronospirillum sp. TaxID=2812955 RepID=UPI0025EF3CA8|nr:uroporphyrinogen-III C-methyltransferase [Natronospirillum sp.]MCH8551633.1 uroporphyrinogen-III C-methyltransferase [Natronospirillum sp.]